MFTKMLCYVKLKFISQTYGFGILTNDQELDNCYTSY